MQFQFFTVLTAFTCLVSAWGPHGPRRGGGKKCLSDAKATEIINTYETLISRSVTGAEFNSTADAILADDFFTMSNSINAEVGKPLEAISIPSKAAFIAAFHAAPPTAGTQTLDLLHTCTQMVWRWLGTSSEGLPVRGLTMMNITTEGQISATFVEYFRPALIECDV
ncbi:uncharacterized protein Z518_06130 [Rhinocladiella mackenziei CBS 650.93]|uniref:NTF2-like domain-containing protein n=1 Tax=Rhinocladiella mackenziei CBS 650.93 TaxID=1442369 RepID=A0A0D2H4B8_9EURO|nr:uncharacterized protein Z518_06130 [Rhinocladiella mackenziei CBS 650.93]KIX05258.1 hypothetical protein Z518_06130 [Rhinocladiella mackenziei CBS 650.93]